MKLLPFQSADLARAALHDGAILSWDTGLGKTWATFIWPLLKVGYTQQVGDCSPAHPLTLSPALVPKAPVLIVAPGDLHRQITDEGWNRFRIRVTPLDKPTFRRICPDGRTLAPGFYLTSYTELGQNHTLFPPNLKDATDAELRAYLRALGHLPPLAEAPVVAEDSNLTAEDILAVWNSSDGARRLRPDIYRHIQELPARDKARLVRSAMKGIVPEELKALAQTWNQSARDHLHEAVRHFLDGTGADPDHPDCRGKNGIRCIVDPTLADEVSNLFACVIVDEGVRVKGDYTYIAEGVRTLDPAYRLVLTATPIKNRLPDVFWLAWWAAGGRMQAHARFPYAGTVKAKGEFSKTFLVSERNLTKEDKAAELGKRRSFVKLRAEVCNIHRLWKLCAPITLRRRKADAGVDIVPKHRHVVRVPLGRRQAAVYEYHLEASYVDKNYKPAPGAQLQALRVAAAHPASTLLTPKDTDKPALPHRSDLPYTPKMAAVMELIAQCLERREQVLVGCALHDPNDYLELLLRKAGVPCVKLDGRTSPALRGELAAQFKAGTAHGPGRKVPVMLAGVECMSEGHSFDQCPNAILPAFSWAFDKFEQFINRVHRLTSRQPVNVFSVICDGTADRKLESSIAEKGDASALVLDGCLGDERNEDLNLAELLQQARLEFHGEKKTVCELELAQSWPALRARLGRAWAAWVLPHGHTAAGGGRLAVGSGEPAQLTQAT